MALLSFGLNRVDQWGEIDQLLKTCPAVRPTVAARLTRAAYQTEYGIYDHARPDKHPLAEVLMHPKENTWEGGPHLTHVRRFYANRYASTWNMTLADYFELPFWAAEFIYELTLSSAENLSPAERKAQQEAQEMERELGMAGKH